MHIHMHSTPHVHSLSCPYQVTSAYIHMLPALLTFLLRWYPTAGLAPPSELHLPTALFHALAFYLAWQLAHTIITELLFQVHWHARPWIWACGVGMWHGRVAWP